MRTRTDSDMRARDHLLDMPQTLGFSHGRTQREQYHAEAAVAKGPLDKAFRYLKTQVVFWGWHYLKSRIGGKYPFPSYTDRTSGNGIYDLDGAGGSDGQGASVATVAIAGDWGTGTEDAHRVGRHMTATNPHFTIHLGDVYFVGTKQEILENMLGEKTEWPNGSRGAFSLNANHEMYARGKAYFTHLLPRLGLRDRRGASTGQQASYFALRSTHWLVIGLDTGYHSVGLPLLEKIFRPSCKLPGALMSWLAREVRVQDDQSRGIVLLSHHQYYSGFERGHDRAARQLEALIRRPVLWFWGHEHRFAMYGKARSRGSQLEAYGRCLGHGGMPVEEIHESPDPTLAERAHLVLYDHREMRLTESTHTPIGYNGFAVLEFDGPALRIEYRDSDDRVIVTERWTVDGSGVIRGRGITRELPHGDVIVRGALTDAQE